MFGKVYKQLRQMWGKLPAFVALVALTASGLVAIDPLPASAAIVTNNLVMNLDGTTTTSLPATGNWTSVSPGTGTFSGTVSGATRAGGTQGGLSFDGNQDYVNFGTGAGAIPGSMTFETWVKPGNLTGTRWFIIASRWFDSISVETNANHDWHFGIYNDGTNAKLQLDTSGQSAPLRGNTNFPLTGNTKWYHVGFTIDAASGKAQIFVNGQADSVQSTTTHSASVNPQLWIGDARNAAAPYVAWLGQISKARMYSAALSSSELMQNFTSEMNFYELAPVNTGAPLLSGRPRVGSTIATSEGTWTADPTASSSYKWQSSTDGTNNWTDIASATAATYTPVSADVGRYIRAIVTKTASAGVTSATTSNKFYIQTSNTIVVPNGGKLTGLTSTVPNDSNTYNVTIATDSVSNTVQLGTTTGLTIVPGYASSSNWMAATLTDSTPIITFRGTGTAINTALANVTFTAGGNGWNDTVRLYYSLADSTATGARNYIPIYDNGQLTFHYYTFKSSPQPGITRSALDTTLATLGTTDNVQATRWYVATTRYQIEWQRYKDLVGATNGAHWGAYAFSGSSAWYWPANTDGYSSATQFSTGSTGSNNLFNGTSTVQPWVTGEPNYATNVDRIGYTYVPGGGSIGWDDTPTSTVSLYWVAETYATTPYNTGSNGALVASVHTAALANAPTSLTAGAPGTSVALSWTAPSAPGTDAITDYEIQYSTDGVNWTSWAHTPSAATSATVTGLNSSNIYAFRVAAFTSDLGAWSSVSMSTNATGSGTIKSLTGYGLPTNASGTLRVLIATNNSAGRLWFGSTTNIDGGVRGTANYPDNTGYVPLNNYQPANLYSSGQMVGLVDTSVTDLNAALATLKYQSPTASTDTITMYVSNGTEYVAIMNGSSVEFHYYGKNATLVTWANAASNSYAGAAQTIDGTSIAAGTPFLATPRYRAENMYVMSVIGSAQAWLGASDATTEGTWKWTAGDANGVQFWSGSQTGSAYNGEYNDWNLHTTSPYPLTEPNGGIGESCLGTNSGGYNSGPVAGYGWNDFSCASTFGYAWETYNTGIPYGSNNTNIAAANYASVYAKQTVTVSAPPAAPTALSVSSSASGQVDLSWTAPSGVSGITSYSVQYSTDGVNWTEDRNSASTETLETITGLSPNTYYQFRVAALTSSATGLFVYGYFSPTGTGKWNTTTSTTNTVSGLSVSASLNTYKMSVLLRASSSNLQLGTITGLGGIRGTANYGSLGTAGQMIGLTGSGSDINTALASLKYVGPATAGNQAISMWVSVGSTTLLPQAYVPVVNSTSGQVEFHYYGATNDPGVWSQAQVKANDNNTSINGQAATGKWLATAETADQNGGVADAIAAYGVAGRYWLGGGDYTSVSSSTADGAWYWMGPDSGFTQFWTGGVNGSAINGSFYNWGANNSTTKQEPNGGNVANCLVATNSTMYTYTSTPSGIGTPASIGGGTAWDDNGCNATDINYVWEYVANKPVGSSTVGSNYATTAALSVAVANNAEAPNMTAAAAGKYAVAVDWDVPTVNASTPITGYTVWWSTSPTFTNTVGTATTTSTNYLVTGLTAGTTYYFRAKATGATWSGVYGTPASAAPTTTATTINVVASGGGVEGTDYLNLNGIIVPVGTSANVNASDVQGSLLTQATTLAADTVNVNKAISWSTSQLLTLGVNTSSTIAIADPITGSGVSSGLAIAGSSYSIDVKNGDEIILSGTSGTFSIGGNAYTLIRSQADLANVTAAGYFALAQPITLTTGYTTSPINVNFTGTFDGLGNTVSQMKILPTTAGYYGFISIAGAAAKVRNLGVINSSIKVAGSSTGFVAGMIVGSSNGAGVTLNQVWSSGLISTLGANTGLAFGGILGNSPSGSVSISRAWTNIYLDTTLSGTGTYLAQGGIVGGDFLNFNQGANQAGGVVSISEAYATGQSKWVSTGWRGIGGIMGLHYSSGGATTYSDIFSWLTFGQTTGANFGGLMGVSDGSMVTITNAYQASHTLCVGGPTQVTKPATCDTKATAGTVVSGMPTSGNWTTTGGTTLANLPTPSTKTPIYVQVTNASPDGSFGTVGYQIVDGFGTVQSTTALGNLGLSVSGTPTYTIDYSTPVSATAYMVDYVSGLSLGGTSAANYQLLPWITSTSVTISKLRQFVTWSPTLSIDFGSGTTTPTAATNSVVNPITYAVTSQGTTQCTVDANTGALTYKSGGTCQVTATAAATGNYLAASVVQSFTITEPATAPSVSATTAGSTLLNIGWTAPTVSSSVAITGYTLTYSTSASMTSPTTINVGNTRGYLLAAPANGAMYYFQVRAVSGSTWVGPLSNVGSATTSTTATTINVVATGGGVAGTDYTVNGGVISTTGTANINASDIAAILATEGTVQVAGTTVNVNAPISWSSNSTLILGNGVNTVVNVNASLTASGNTAGVKIAASSYSLQTKTGTYIRLTGTTPTFNLGGTAYTVVNTVAGLSALTASSYWVLGAPITLSNNYTGPVLDQTFSGIMDGLGNTVNNMQITVGTAVNSGFYNQLGGATIRNVGFTNVNINSAVAFNHRLGAVAGNGSYSGTNTITQVWSTGFITETTAAVDTEAGGLFGGATAGTLNISKSWSSVTVSTNSNYVGSGGIIGTNVSGFAGTGTPTSGNNTLSISETYSTGNILRNIPGTAAWMGNGGIIGVAYGYSATITNSFSWGNINSTGGSAGTSTAGIIGVGYGASYASVSNSYSTNATCAAGASVTNCVNSATPGTALTSGTGFTSGVWQTANGTSLVNLPLPTKNLYVKVVAPTNGAYEGITYQIVDSTGTVQTLSSLNLSISGTPTYTIASDAAKGTYPNVAYVSGLTLGGSAAAVYSLSAWKTNTSVTISAYSQNIIWSPNTDIKWGTGSFTPSNAPTGLGTPTFTYNVSNAGTTGCTVNSSTGAVTYTNSGTCAITTTATATGYVTTSMTVSFVIAAPKTITIVASDGGSLGVDYSISGGYLTTNNDVNVNASDLATALASGSVIIAGNVVVNAPVTWSANTTLTLGSQAVNTVAINAGITASGASAGLVIKPTSYSLDTKTGASIVLSGASSTLSIGGTSYTLIRAIADLASVGTTGNYALAGPLAYSTAISNSPIAVAFAGTFDGLGNTVDKMALTYTSNSSIGFIKNLNGGTLRNLGITNAVISLEPAATTYSPNVGTLVGDSTGGTLDQVWTTGFSRVKAGSTYSSITLGGLVGDVYSGTLNITKSWSGVNITAWGSTVTNLVMGGIVGGTLSAWTSTGASASGSVSMSQVYATGDLANPQTTGITGMGGLLGVHLGTGSVTLNDTFSWSQMSKNAGLTAFGGLVGNATGGTLTYNRSAGNSTQNVPATATSTISGSGNYLSFTPGITSAPLEANANWYASSNGTSLVNLPVPYKSIYVQVVAPSNNAYVGMGYQITNGVGAILTLANYNLTVTGTPTYSIASDVTISATPYAVNYVSGLTITNSGSKPNLYRYSTYPIPTSVTISKYPQTITWTPTQNVAFGTGSITPSALATASTTVTYAVADAGTTGCTVNSTTAVITAISGGVCKVTATAANSGNYLAASVDVSFTIPDPSAAPTSVTATVIGNNGVYLNWTAPTPTATTALTGYQILYSTSASMASPTTVSTSNAWSLVTGLTAGTQYYFQVRAVNGSTWSGALSSAVSATTAASTLTVAATGGTADTTWKNLGGIIYPVGSGIINAADLATLLDSGSITLAADTINVNADVTWASQQRLTLGYASGNTVNINSVITTTGNNATLSIAPATYNLSVKSGAKILISGTGASLNIGGNAYTLLRSTTDISAVTASGYYALAAPVSYSTALTNASAVNLAFGGTFDGLGNTVSGLTINVSTAAAGFNGFGFFKSLSSAAVRNFGVTGFTGKLGTTVGVIAMAPIAGTSAGATIDQVWSTGQISVNSGATYSTGAGVALGGIVGNANTGTTTITKSWSSAGLDASAATSVTNQMIGGLVGSDMSSVAQANSDPGGSLVLRQVYATGTINAFTSSWTGVGGLVGIHWSAGTLELTDGFSWSKFVYSVNNKGGLVGVSSGGTTTITNAYTVYTRTISTDQGVATQTNTAANASPGTAVAGMTTANWTTSATLGSILTNVAAPKIPIYAKVVAPTDGSYATVGYSWVDVNGNAKTLSGLNLSVTGTPVYSIASNVANGTYNTTYVSGLTLGGTAAGNYEIFSWPTATSVVITKQAQSVSFTSTAPANAKAGQTYLVTATATSGLTAALSIDSTSSSICSISGSTVTFNAVGSCTVNANQIGSTGYTAAAQVQQVITVGKGSQTVSFTSTAPSAAVYNGTTYTVTATGSTTSGVAVVFTIESTSSQVCSVSGSTVSFIGVGTCTVNANQAGNANYEAATQVQQSFTVGKASQTISGVSTAPSNAVVAGATYTVSATGGASGSSLTYVIDATASAVCSITAQIVSFQTPGTCLININQPGNDNYNAATQYQQSFIVGKGAQVLTFTSSAPNGAKVGGRSYTVTATGGATTSAIVLSVHASSTSKCSVSGMVVTYLAVGDCVLNLNQAGDSNYNAAAQVQQIVPITSDGRCPYGTVSGNYCLIRFNASGTWTVPAGVTSVDMLAVGGGGAGGSGAGGQTSGGGGGGGEVIESLAKVVIPGTKFTITVGAGGTGGIGTASATASAGTDGGQSTIAATNFTTITARGGGHGASWKLDGSNGNIGISLPAGGPGLATGGGGSAQTSTRANAAGIGDLFTGGAAKSHDTDATLQSGGGGAGAGGAGTAGTATVGGAGGIGKNSTILGTLLGGGGGGGKRFAPGTAGTASAGGGAGGVTAAGTAGTANTGGGGGGSAGSFNGANGGSGVVVIRVALQSQTVAFTSTAPTGLIYGTSTTYTPTASGTDSESAVEITVDSSSSSVCSIASGVVSVIGAGTCTLNANQAANGFFSAATQVQQSFTVAKKAQTVAFTSTAPSSAVVEGATYTPAATGSDSGIAIVFTVSGTCSIASGVVSFTSVGTCTVKADQAGNTNYTAASQVTQTITVGKGTQVVSFTSSAPNNAVVDGSSYTPTATGGASGNSVVITVDSASSAICAITNGAVRFNAVGDCVLKVNQAGNSNWNAAATVTQTIAVGKGNQTLVFTSSAPNNAVVAGATYTPTATGGATNNEITFSIDQSSAAVCELTNGVISFLAVGDCKVLADQSGDGNYLDASQAYQTFSVGKGSQVILFTTTAPSNSIVSGVHYNVAAMGGASGNEVTFSIAAASASYCSIEGAEVSFIGAGNCVVEANQAGNDHYNAAAKVTQSFTVGKGTQTVRFTSSAPANAKVEGATYTPVVTELGTEGSVSITVDAQAASVCAISNGEVSFNSVGTCILNANQTGTANFNAADQVTQEFQVTEGTQTITYTSSAPTDAVVDGATYTPTATGGSTGNAVTFTIASASAHICTISAGVVTFIGTGDCDILANQAGNTNFHAAHEVMQSVSVGKGAQAITWTSTVPSNAVVGGSTYSPTATGGASQNAVTFRGDLNTASVCTVSNGAVSFVGVGTCVIFANQAGNSNYLAAPQVSQTITVGKGSQTISFTSTVPSSAKVGGATYSPTATGGATGNNVTFTIAVASAAVCSIAAGKVSFQAPGNCVIQANQAGSSNYLAATQATQTVTVAKGTQSIVFVSSAPSGAKVDGTTYQPSATGGATGNSVTYSVSPSSSAICSVSGGVVSFNAVGSCVILANQAGNANYEAATQVSQTIGVAKGIQVLTFTSEPPSHAQVQGTTYTPVATGGNSGQAIVYSIDPAASALCRITNGVVSFQAVGDCIVHADQAGNTNYLAATRITQVFDITKGPQAISNLSSAPLGATVEGAGYQVSASGGGGTAPVTYSISAMATDICTVTGDIVSFQAAGTCIVLFDQAGDANYNAANQVSQSFTVGRGSQTLEFSSQAPSATVDGAAYTPSFVRGHSVSAVSLSISPASSAECEVVSGSIVFHSVGDCVVDANQEADANYEAAPTVSQTISVTRGNQVPLEAHSSITNLVLGDQDPTAVVSLSGGSGTGAVAWAVSAESQSVCSISGDVVTGFATGFCELTATKDGDTNYLEAVTTLTLTVSTGGQIPVQVNLSEEYPTYAPDLTISMTLAGGSGDGAIWFETLTPHVCNTDGSGTLQILHAGTCTVVGHKDGDSNFSAVSNEKTFIVSRAFQDLASIDLASELTYSPTGSVSTAINLYDSPSEGSTTYSVTDGSCSIDEGNMLVATAAGSCTVNADVEGDENYLPVTISSTFRIAKAAQDTLSITRQAEAPAAITWQGVNETKYDVSGGNGDGELSASSITPVICSVDLTDGVLTVTGLDQGTCTVSVSRDGNDNYLIGTTNFDVEVLDLPDAPASLNLANAGRAGTRSMSVNVTWPATVASDTTAAVNGYIVQTSTNGTDWVTANVDPLGVDARSLTVTVDAWTKVYFRVGATSALDPADGSNRRWVTFNRDGDPEPDPFDIVGALVNISTTLAASTSGELVTITGTGFDPAITTEVELTSATPVFTARLGRAGAAALSTSKVVPVTVISETELTFNLPKITMAKGVTRLATQIKILTTNGMDSLPVALDYIPKKLSQVMTLTGALPAANTVINVGTPLSTNGTFTSTGVTPVVTATPITVCTAVLDANNKLVITPVGPGKCSISVQSPATPAYTASTVKTASYTVKSSRTTGFSVTAAGVNDDGSLTEPSTFTAINTLLTPGVINVSIGDDPIDIPVTLSAREGTILFTVNPADEAAGRCTADPGEGTTGSISVTDVGDCLVTISQPADSGWYVGETIKVKIHAVARTTPAAPDNGQAVPADPEDLVVDPTDPDDPATPPVSLTINPNSNAEYSFGTEDAVGYDPLTGTFTMKTRTALVGTWTGYMKSPSPAQKWFKGKVVKKIQQYTNICPIKLVVKKDKKLKKRVLRVVATCVLSPEGKTAMTQVGIQKIKIKYKRIRQYAKTGLTYQGTAKAKKRILKPINRTIILKIGRVN